MDPDQYVQALRFAARAHGDQKTPHGMPYVVHLTCVANEVCTALQHESEHDMGYAVQCALLHDVVEDTPVTVEQVAATFGEAVAAGVSALSKDPALPKPEQMPDSVRRILEQPVEVAIVKLGDRITNLGAPPVRWSAERVAQYRAEAEMLLAHLGHASPMLAARLQARIDAYPTSHEPS